MDSHRMAPRDVVEHATFVRRLAVALLRNESDADDVAQQTLAIALERGPREAAASRPWLASVVRHAVAGLRRRAGRRARRERRAARPEAVAGTADLAARAEVLRLVGEAVRALDAEDRVLVGLRHYDGLVPGEIAARLGLPVTTVKSRLQRTHARLRDELVRRERRWKTGLVLLAGASPTMGSPAPTALGSWARGGSTMGTPSKIAGVAALLLAACGWFFLPTSGGSSGETLGELSGDGAPVARLERTEPPRPGLLDASPERAGAGPSLPTSPPRLGGAATPDVPTGPASASAARTEPARSIEGTVTLDGRPVTGGRVRVVAGGQGEEGREVAIAADGTFRITGIESGGVVLVAEVVGATARQVTVRVGREGAHLVTVAFGTARIWGTVFDGSGRPVAGAAVRAASHLRAGPGGLAPTAEGDPFVVQGRTDAWGHYEFRGLPAGLVVVVAEPAADGGDARNIRSFPITLGGGEERRLDIGSPQEDPTWSGVVRYADGVPIEGSGSLFLQTEDGNTRLYVSFDAQGRFAQAVPPGRYRMEFVLTRPSPSPAQRLPLGEKATLPLPDLRAIAMRCVPTEERLTVERHALVRDVTLPGTRIEGRLQTHGQEEPGSTLTPQRVVLTRLGPSESAPGEALLGTPGPSYAAVVGGDGRFLVDGLASGTYSVGGSPRALRPLGEPATLEITGDPARRELSVTFASE